MGVAFSAQKHTDGHLSVSSVGGRENSFIFFAFAFIRATDLAPREKTLRMRTGSI